MTADTVGGVWTYALELAGTLGEQGVEVALATMGALTPQQRAGLVQIPNLEVFEGRSAPYGSPFKLEWMEDPWEDVRQAGEWLLLLEERIQPDIVHLNGYVHGSLTWKTPTLVVGHSCVLSWWEAVKREAAPAVWDRYRVEVRRGLQAANLVIAPTKAMLHALNQHYGLIVNGRVIPNGRDSVIFEPKEKKKFVLTAGRLWDEAKNVASLDCIAPKLPWPIYIAGEEKYPDGRTDARNSLRTSNVNLLGRLSTEELASWYAHAAIYALPARYEPFGLSVLEAALSGCALVLGDIPSLREIWGNSKSPLGIGGDSAVFVPPDDRDAIASALNTLIGDPTLRAALALEARKRALEFTAQRMAGGYLAAYQDLIQHQTNACL